MSTFPRRRITAVAIMTFLPFAFGACADDATGPAQGAVVGRYQLQTVNGASLPFVVVQSDTSKGELTSDQLTLNADGTFSDIEGLRTTHGTTVTTKQASSIGVYESQETDLAGPGCVQRLGASRNVGHHLPERQHLRLHPLDGRGRLGERLLPRRSVANCALARFTMLTGSP